MRIAEALAALPSSIVTGTADSDISAITYNSAEVTPDACFVAIKGRWRDGHQHIGEALRLGATLVVGTDPAPADFPPDHVYAQVEDSRRELATLADTFYGRPSQRMAVIGVTGTDGKTSVTNLVDAILEENGIQTGLMSTVDFKIAGVRQKNNTRFTTLEAPEVQERLAEMLNAGTQVAVVETTSSGLALYRVWQVAYDVAVVTNVTSEHLELHGTREAYLRAKAMLPEAVDPGAPKSNMDLPHLPTVPKACVLNADDSSYEYMLGFCRAPVVSYGLADDASVRAMNVELRAEGSSFDVRLPDGTTFAARTSLVADYNISNCLAAISVGYLFGVAPERMAAALASFPGVPGRMERIEMGQPFTVVVDYAHTAESLEKILNALRPLTSGRLIAVFGSAGDRDRVKRPAMGAVAGRLADFAVITDEDPRTEDAMSILLEIAAGAEEVGARAGERYSCVVGRRIGISAAFAMARAEDTVLLAGKGHEQSIIIGSEKLPWDDRQVARDELRALGYSGAPNV
jgi:UDP-N-acetylmuramoyl-L-alanyl-D-glutamate--2,6-diaminopimelate ligase